MRRGRTKGPLILFLFIIAGMIIGGMIGSVLASYSDAKIFHQEFNIGTQNMPGILDFSIIKLAFGLTLTINFGTILGVIIGIILYFKY